MELAAKVYAQIIFPESVSVPAAQLSDMQKTMLNATPDCIKVVSVDGRLLMMNKAGCLALNVPEDSGFGMPWLPLLPEEVFVPGTEALRKAASGQTARFPGKSISPSGTVYWDNLLTPLIDYSGQVLSILCVSRDVTEKTLLEKQLEDAIGREKLLSREMNHRIKNVFSLVSGLIFIAEKEAAAAGTPEAAVQILRHKLDALSRASDTAFAHGDCGEESARLTDLESVVSSVLEPYRQHCSMSGAEVFIHRNAVTTFALFLHELATNSVKYGALSTADGHVTLHWETGGEGVRLTWSETGGPDIATSPKHCGFGSEMVDRIVRSMQGSLTRTWHAKGLVVDLFLPHVALG